MATIPDNEQQSKINANSLSAQPTVPFAELTLTLQTCAEEKRARVRQIWPRAVSGRSEAYFTGREILLLASPQNNAPSVTMNIPVRRVFLLPIRDTRIPEGKLENILAIGKAEI